MSYADIMKKRKIGEEVAVIVESKVESALNNNQSLSLFSAKEKILSTDNLDNIIENIKYFDKQATLSFFYLSHCFYKIREEKLYEQKGYTIFTEFVDRELTDFARTQVYNYLKVAEMFPIETSTNILELGSTKLVEISKIKNSHKRLKYLNENLYEIKNISTRELRLKVSELNMDCVEDDIAPRYIKQWKDLSNKFNLFLDNVNIDQLENDKIDMMKNSLNEIENKIKYMQDKLNRKFTVDCKNYNIDS